MWWVQTCRLQRENGHCLGRGHDTVYQGWGSRYDNVWWLQVFHNLQPAECKRIVGDSKSLENFFTWGTRFGTKSFVIFWLLLRSVRLKGRIFWKVVWEENQFSAIPRRLSTMARFECFISLVYPICSWLWSKLVF